VSRQNFCFSYGIDSILGQRLQMSVAFFSLLHMMNKSFKEDLMMPSYFSYPNFPNIYGDHTAIAHIIGSLKYPNLKGIVVFKDSSLGAQIWIDIVGLPEYRPATNTTPPIGPHGFHIHEFGICEDDSTKDSFQSAGGHWNPDNQPHGNHAGDFPVLFSHNGISKMWFYTSRFQILDIIGKSVIVHENPDDYRTQPDGDAGKRMGCGVIKLFT
jgi:superoxide dismutase, Cu-Zn family